MSKFRKLSICIGIVLSVILSACNSNEQNNDIVLFDDKTAPVQQEKYLDLSGEWDLTNNLELVADVENLSDKNAVINFRFAHIGKKNQIGRR